MPAVKPLRSDIVRERRRALHQDIEQGGLTVSETIRRIRHALGMTQARFAEVFKLTPRQVWELENGKSNPTLETLARIGKPFGFQAGFVLPRPSEEAAREIKKPHAITAKPPPDAC